MIWPAKIDSELFFTIGAILRFWMSERAHPLGAPSSSDAVKRVRKVATDHRLVHSRRLIFRGISDDLFAIAQHGDPVGRIERLFQRMADEDDGNAVHFEVAQRSKKYFLSSGSMQRSAHRR